MQVTFSKTKSKCARILGWPSKFFYSGTNMLLIIFFQPFFIASIMELVENDFSTTYSVLSYTGSLFIILLTLVTFVAVWVMNMKAICQYRSTFLRKMFKSYVDSIKDKNLFAHFYFPAYLTKTFIISFLYLVVSNGYIHTSFSVVLTLFVSSLTLRCAITSASHDLSRTLFVQSWQSSLRLLCSFSTSYSLFTLPTHGMFQTKSGRV